MASFKDVLNKIVEGAYGDKWRQAALEREKIASEQAGRALDQSKFDETVRSNKTREGQTNRQLGQGDERILLTREGQAADLANSERSFAEMVRQFGERMSAGEADRAARERMHGESIGVGQERNRLAGEEFEARQADRAEGRKVQEINAVTDFYQKQLEFAAGDPEKISEIERKRTEAVARIKSGEDPKAVLTQLEQPQEEKPGLFMSAFNALNDAIARNVRGAGGITNPDKILN